MEVGGSGGGVAGGLERWRGVRRGRQEDVSGEVCFYWISLAPMSAPILVSTDLRSTKKLDR